MLAAFAAALHVLIFWMESIAWRGPLARRTFGPATDAEVEATAELAYNQGFYNLFLAILTALGIALCASGHVAVGATLVLAGCGCMLAAASVLLLSSPHRRGAAIRQGALPLLAVGAMGVARLLG
ncbi:DUF1304 domain-containing protein [Brachybacterium equifaecis]|uniref:DUF1304 domain-containing protein n=1 Tax=Brachybacterium equifaecis TaxID=2910770 RepID=UPI003220693A